MSKPQIVYIHGGDSFETSEQFYAFLHSIPFDPYAPEYETWRKWLQKEVVHSHDFLYIEMPNKLNAEYEAWKIWFEKVVPHLRDGVVCIGYSLGGGFLLRYLSENKVSVEINQVHLVAPCVDEVDCEGVGGFKINLATWDGFKSDINHVHLWHSSDDPIVPVHHSERFVAKYPKATLHRFEDKSHFFISAFPELLDTIIST